MPPKTLKIGCGSAYDGDRIDWSVDLAKAGLVSYMGFDCLAEATMTIAQLKRVQNPDDGYATNLKPVVDQFAGFVKDGLTCVGNFGGSNTHSAVNVAVKGFRDQGIHGVKIGAIHGDDIREKAYELDLDIPDLGCKLSEIKEPVVSVNVYTGAAELIELLGEGAKFIIGGRTADPTLYVAPICYELGWSLDDFQRVAEATTVGHLLECGILVSGGRLANPPRQVIKDMFNVGMPYAEVSDDEIIISKTPGTGGVVDERSVKLQLAYEIHDPSRYMTPDVTLDVSRTSVEVVGEDRVRVTGMTGHGRPDTLKVLVGVDLGWKVVSEVSFGGPGALERAQYAQDLLAQRTIGVADQIVESRADLIGYNSLFGEQVHSGGYPPEVRLRFAARFNDEAAARAYSFETRHIGFSIAGATAVSPSIERFIGVTRAYCPRDAVNLETELVTT
jgi:hypothetical protein